MTTPALPRVMSPAAFAERASRGQWARAPHLNLLNAKLLKVAGGQCRRLAVFGPPRHGKSEFISIFFVAWYLGTYPDRTVIMASHSASLAASKFGMRVRDVLEEWGPSEFGVSVRSDRRAIDNWAIEGHKGGMRSVGVGGSLIGEGADLAIFDDIIPDAEAALSETIRNSTHDWYLSTARTRINAGGAQIFTMQRWHDDDPAARIVFAHQKLWDIVSLPAIAEEGDVLGRSPGEALWPERPNPIRGRPPIPMWPLPVLEEIRDGNEFWFAAQFQQRPVPRGGGMFKAAWFADNVVHYRPKEANRVRFWDRAASDGKGDYTVGVLMSRKGDCYYVEDVIRGQWGTHERDRIIRAAAVEDNARYPFAITTWGEQEPGSSGKDQALAFERMLAPFAAHCEPSTGSKVVRADGFAGACGRGEVRMVSDRDRGPTDRWNDAFVQEMSTFPFGKKDDQVDASSGAYNKLALGDDGIGTYCAMDADDFAVFEGAL
jgi:predicted phage terminase large subunit-like protein